MATEKLFSIAGTSNGQGEFKCRFANDAMRVKKLEDVGLTDVILIELPHPMTKLAAVQFIQPLDEFQSAEQQACIAAFLERRTAKPAARVPRAKKAAAVVEAVEQDAEQADESDTAETQDSQLEDAPF